MGFFSNVLSAGARLVKKAKKVASRALGKVVKWGKKLVRRVEAGWKKVKKGVRNAVAAVQEMVREGLVKAGELIARAWEAAKRLLGIETVPPDPLVEIVDTIQGLIALIERRLEQNEVTDFTEYLRLFSILRILRRMSDRLRLVGMESLNESAIRAIQGIIVLAERRPGNQQVAIEWIDEYCCELFGKHLIVLACETLNQPWTQERIERRQLDLDLRNEVSDLHHERFTLESEAEIEGMNAEIADRLEEIATRVERCQALMKRNQESIDQLEVISQVLAGLLVNIQGEEASARIEYQSERVADIFMSWDGESKFDKAQLLRLKAFAAHYQARAAEMASEVNEEFEHGLVQVGV